MHYCAAYGDQESYDLFSANGGIVTTLNHEFASPATMWRQRHPELAADYNELEEITPWQEIVDPDDMVYSFE